MGKRFQPNKDRDYPKENLLNTWKYLHVNDYFENHKLYDMTKVFKPPMITKKNIENKIIVEIGCGYGRHTVWFSKYVKEIYAIDVSSTILNKAKKFTGKRTKKKIEFILAENYKKLIPKNIDLIYCYLVFQHLHKKETQDYINTFYKKLKSNGLFIAQFFSGNSEKYYEFKEPKITYNIEQIQELFKLYKTDIIEIKKSKPGTYHYYVIGEKK